MEYNRCGIYCLTSTATGLKYYGSSIDVDKRFKQHKSKCKQKNHANNLIQDIWNLYGEDDITMSLIQNCHPEELLTIEQEYLYKGELNINKSATSPPKNIKGRVHQLSMNNEYIQVFESASSAGRVVDCSIEIIQKAVRDVPYGIGGQFKWILELDEVRIEPHQAVHIAMTNIPSTRIIEVDKITGMPTGRSFESVKSIADTLNVSMSAVYYNIDRKHRTSFLDFDYIMINCNKSEKWYLGSDPGKAGAIVLINGDRDKIYKLPTPMIKTQFDLNATAHFFREWSPIINHMIIENVHAFKQGGSTSNFSFGQSLMLLKCGAAMFNIPYTMITPGIWQKDMWISTDKVYKSNKGSRKKIDTKATSLIAVKRLFPEEDLRDPNRKTDRAVNAHDGIVDAILMAEYCRKAFHR